MKVFFPFKCVGIFASACDKMQRLKISTTMHTEQRVTLTEFKGKPGYISHQEQSCHRVKERVPRADPGARISMCDFTMGLRPTVPGRALLILHHRLRAQALPSACTHTGQKCPPRTPGLARGLVRLCLSVETRPGLKELTSPLDSPAPISSSAFAPSTSTGTSTSPTQARKGSHTPGKPPNQSSTYSAPRRTGQVTMLKALGQEQHSLPGWRLLHTCSPPGQHAGNTKPSLTVMGNKNKPGLEGRNG